MSDSRCDRVSSWASLLGGFCYRKGSFRRLGTLLVRHWITGMTVSPFKGENAEPAPLSRCRLQLLDCLRHTHQPLGLFDMEPFNKLPINQGNAFTLGERSFVRRRDFMG